MSKYVSAFLQQKLNDVGVTSIRGPHKRCPSTHVPVLDIGTLLSKNVHDFRVTISAGTQQRRPIVIIFGLHICTAQKQLTNE